MTAKPITLVAGQPVALPIQCYLRGTGGTIPAAFGATDILSAAVVQSRQTVPTFVPAVAWYTAGATQTGYGQGQVEPVISPANAALLVPTTAYTLLVWRALASNPGVFELIARKPLVIEPIAA